MTKKFFHSFVYLAVAMVVGTGSKSKAEVIFNNIDSNATASPVSGATWAAQRFRFSGSTNYTLNSVSVKMQRDSGSSAPILQIYDGNSSRPSAFQYLLTAPGSVTTLNTYTFTVPTSFTLNADTDYWVVLKAADAPSSYQWAYAGGISGTGIAFQTESATTADNGFNWVSATITPYQMTVNATAVPEPGTMALGAIALASGGVGTWWRRRRKSNAASEV